MWTAVVNAMGLFLKSYGVGFYGCHTLNRLAVNARNCGRMGAAVVWIALMN